MGSGPSRGKKVAPACISEVNVTKTTAGVPSPKQDSRIFKPLKIHAVLRNARNRAQPDCHSQGPDSDFSGEDEDIDAELDTVLADYEERERITAKKQPPKKTFMKSKTYGLCHLGREDTEDEVSAAPRLSASGGAEEPRVPRGGSEDVNKRSNDAFTHLKKTHSVHQSAQFLFLLLFLLTGLFEKRVSAGLCAHIRKTIDFWQLPQLFSHHASHPVRWI